MDMDKMHVSMELDSTLRGGVVLKVGSHAPSNFEVFLNIYIYIDIFIYITILLFSKFSLYRLELAPKYLN